MTRPTLHVRRAIVHCVTLYTCAECRTQAQGDIATLTLDVDHAMTLHDLGPQLASMGVHASHIPVGWASYGQHSYRCPACKR